MKHKDMDEKWKEKSETHIRHRWEQLQGLTEDYTNYVLKYIFATNSGGAIATMSFMGVTKNSPDQPDLTVTLVIFVLGIIFAAGPMFYLLHYFENLLVQWNKDTRKFHNDEIGYRELNERDDSRINRSIAAWVMGYSSFIFFILGVGWAAFKFLCI